LALPSKRRCLIACRRGYRPLHEFDGAAMFIRFTPYIGKNRNEHDVGEAWFKSLPLANALSIFYGFPHVPRARCCMPCTNPGCAPPQN
jgi:hypothetical protein